MLLGASTALNFAVMGSLYPENTKEALKKDLLERLMMV
jgi:hypothetical protein